MDDDTISKANLIRDVDAEVDVFRRWLRDEDLTGSHREQLCRLIRAWDALLEEEARSIPGVRAGVPVPLNRVDSER